MEFIVGKNAGFCYGVNRAVEGCKKVLEENIRKNLEKLNSFNELIEEYNKYKDNKDFVLLVIGREHTDEQLKAYNERKKFTFPLYPDPKREVFSLFAEKSIPRTYLFNKEGEAIYTSIGYEKEEFNHLMNTIEEALK